MTKRTLLLAGCALLAVPVAPVGGAAQVVEEGMLRAVASSLRGAYPGKAILDSRYSSASAAAAVIPPDALSVLAQALQAEPGLVEDALRCGETPRDCSLADDARVLFIFMHPEVVPDTATFTVTVRFLTGYSREPVGIRVHTITATRDGSEWIVADDRVILTS